MYLMAEKLRTIQGEILQALDVFGKLSRIARRQKRSRMKKLLLCNN